MIVKLAVGLDPNDVGTFFAPVPAPLVGTLVHVNLVEFVILHSGDAVEPGTVIVIPELGKT